MLSNTELECAVLGTILTKNCMKKVRDENLFASEDFTTDRNKNLFKVFCELSETNQDIDLLTVVNHAEQEGLDLPLAWTAELMEHCVTEGALNTYSKSIKELTTKRKVFELGTKFSELAKGNITSEELVHQVAKLFKGIDTDTSNSKVESFLDTYKSLIEDLKDTSKKCEYIPSGYKQLDKKIKGFFKGGLNIIGARSGVGKSALVVNLLSNILMREETTRPAILFSLEMPNKQVLSRFLCLLGHIDNNAFLEKRVEPYQWSNVFNAIQKLVIKDENDNHIPKLFFDDSTAITVADIASKCRALSRKYGGLSCIAVDYLQLMRSGKRTENRTLEIADFTRQLKLLAKEFDCPVLCLSQLNRSIENRKSDTPQMSDLRESGAIEQDADLILFITRNDNTGETTVHIAKNRNGETGQVPFRYEGKYFKFEELGNPIYDNQV